MGADLHVHTIYSDGSFTPEALIKLAVDKGLDTLAIADHDTVEGVKVASKLNNNYGVEIIPAIEFSTFRAKAEIHILGYYIDISNKKLLAKIKEIFTARIERAKKMVSALQERGIKITFAQVKSIAGDDYVGRPHIARALVDSGYIQEMGQAFNEKYIGNDAPAYIPKYKVTPEEAITLIREAGGLPVLAHPVFINHGQPLGYHDISEMKDNGLAGIEVYHSKHSSSNCKFYKEIAEELDMLITGGTDFHGENSPGVELGDVVLDDKYVEALRRAADGRKSDD